jgi:hypothetical protein
MKIQPCTKDCDETIDVTYDRAKCNRGFVYLRNSVKD